MSRCSLVIANPDDESAFWLFQQLKEAGLNLEFITPVDLIGARKWTSWLSDEESRFHIELPDGRELSTERISGAINRVTHLPRDLFSSFDEYDGTYVESEFHALLLSFLNEIPGPVLNRPSSRWLAGYTAYDAEWRKMASHAGLPLYKSLWKTGNSVPEDYTTSYPVTVIIAGKQAIPDYIDPQMRTACLALAEMANCQLLEIRFEEINHTTYFAGATPFVDFLRGGKPLVHSIKSALTSD